MGIIYERVQSLLKEIDGRAKLLLATKERTVDEIREAILAGANIFGENYLQEAESKIIEIGHIVEWHFIGAIQKRKVKKIVELFDVIESVSSLEIAQIIDRECKKIGKVMPVLIEVNSGKEPQKSGVMPEDVEVVAKEISKLDNILLSGLMTMGPNLPNPEDLRPYFRITYALFNELKNSSLFKVNEPILSMGMSSSYKIAIVEGANLVRIGTLVFGERKKKDD
uniref:Pyridoxal phosphate homeostasis protein n=1 Tax=Caldisericum exile TaxID=693075 RepID=A0A7C4U2K2_9BACT